MSDSLNRRTDRRRPWLGHGANICSCALLLLLIVAVSGPAAAAEAAEAAEDQEFEARLREAEAELDAAARKLREVYEARYASKDHSRKAMLGVLVEHGKGDAGVPLTGLTPGGGAEAAGLRSGDVLVSINGVRLDDPEDDRSSMKALTAQMAEVAPGDSVAVGYRRDGAEKVARITTRAHQKDLNALLDSLDVDVDIDFSELGDELAEAAESVAMSALSLASMAPKAPRLPEGQEEASVLGLKQLAAATAGLTVAATPDRFIDLDPDLAAYFGVEAGVLAVGMGGTGDGLRSGDVLLSLGGEPTTDAASARAQLDAAEGVVTAEVLRQGETRVLELDSDLYQSARRVSVIRISQDGEDVEVTIDSEDG